MSEASLQANVIKYLKLQYPSVIYCASLGGQYQPYISQRNKAKATGYVKGFPDLGIYEPRGKYHGLFIEIKEQKEWITQWSQRGYMAVVCKGIDSIIKVIDEYLSMK